MRKKKLKVLENYQGICHLAVTLLGGETFLSVLHVYYQLEVFPKPCAPLAIYFETINATPKMNVSPKQKWKYLWMEQQMIHIIFFYLSPLLSHPTFLCE